MGTKSHEHNQFAPVVVKYFAAQIFLAVAHLHGKGYFWGDPKQANIVVMSDFTLRIIDVGEITMTPARNFKDFCFVAAMINNMIVSMCVRSHRTSA
jgi:serine/threonine protein kinase